jgi:hypothetical protein
MTDEKVTLDPDGWAIRTFIIKAVNNHIDTPVAYAFNDDWPVTLTGLEATEVAQAVQAQDPDLRNPHGTEHKKIALREINKARIDAYPDDPFNEK